MNVNSLTLKKRSRSDAGTVEKTTVVVANKTNNTNSVSLGLVAAVLAQEGWLDASSVCVLERTCRVAKNSWCSDESVWKPVVLHAFPHLKVDGDNNDSSNNNNKGDKQQQQQQLARPVIGGVEIESYKSVFINPRLWLAASAEKVATLAKWSESTHYNVECGRCGCNCTEGLCGGIPIETEFRWEKKDQKGMFWPMDRQDVPVGEGYIESGRTMIRVNRFCETCFDHLVDLKILQQDDYVKTPGVSLFDTVTQEMVQAITERECDMRRQHHERQVAAEKKKCAARGIRMPRDGCRTYYTPFFASGESWSWQKMHKNVEPDDIAIVVANALIQEGCQTRYLQLDGIHWNDPGLGDLGYKALAFALAFNKKVERIDFYQDWGEICCGGRDTTFSYAEDKSNGFILKALQYNKESALKKLPLLCPAAFGPQTWKAWQEAKPTLENCGPTFDLEIYHDWEEYLSFSDDEEEGDY